MYSRMVWSAARSPCVPRSEDVDAPAFDAAVAHIQELWATEGPFDALLGFSQGPRCRGVEVFQLGLLGNALKFV